MHSKVVKGSGSVSGVVTSVKALRETLAGVLHSKDASFFLCGADATLSQITLHTIHRNAVTASLKAARAALADAGLNCSVNVIAHNKAVLDQSQSLEQLLTAFPHEVLIHDPTAVFGRARALVMAVERTRAEFGKDIGGIYLNPAARLLFVMAAKNGLETRVVAALEAAIETSAAALGSIQLNRPPIRVRVVGELPKLELVAIDKQSIQTAGRLSGKRWLVTLAAAIGLAAAPTAVLADQGATKFQTASAALPSLSVFSDGGGVSAFTSQGLSYYFGMSIKLSAHQQVAQVQMPQVNVLGVQVRPRTGVPGQDESQGGSVGS